MKKWNVFSNFLFNPHRLSYIRDNPISSSPFKHFTTIRDSNKKKSICRFKNVTFVRTFYIPIRDIQLCTRAKYNSALILQKIDNTKILICRYIIRTNDAVKLRILVSSLLSKLVCYTPTELITFGELTVWKLVD